MTSAAAERILVVDVGGNHVKLSLGTGGERRRFSSGPELTAAQMVAGVLQTAAGWEWDTVSLGIPAVVRHGGVVAEPVNLGDGWVGFDYEGAFGKPVRIANDATMQAIGSYDGGRMLFLGLGTGLGSTMILDGVVAPMELGHLPFRKHTIEEYTGQRVLENESKKKWRATVFEVVELLSAALQPDYVVIGGGGVKDLEELPPNCRRGGNDLAAVGGVRLWDPQPNVKL